MSALFIDLASLAPGYHRVGLECQASEIGISQTEWPKTVRGDFDVEKSGYQVRVKGLLTAVASLECVRCLKTFELRMQRHNQNGQSVAEFLAAHPRVEKVYYPGLPSHPHHAIAKKQMRGCGGVVTFTIRGADWRATADVVDRVQIPRIGPSLGGVESLIEQPLVMSYFDYTVEERATFGIPDNMIRLSCGIENTEDLIADLKQALG